MAIAEIIAGIVKGVLGTGVDIWTTIEDNKRKDQASREAKSLAFLQRSDQLKEGSANRALTLKGLQQQAQRDAQSNAQFGKEFALKTRSYNNDQVKRIADDITEKANKSKEYQNQLVQLWGE